ncbi:hypothetical protein J4760_04005 [Salinicoccus sp. ID82-1]|uniref:hypothetical protein n=1 Tax=Salinicoccus sp. ID82-1 TaxID=2820269 RepID=UPI001F169B05|nr:hypothetical protein [Salinicoccus sp. ID82-1]MCG1009215.1 hypothetical protein [Salinicoccus sp. ID82-1]
MIKQFIDTVQDAAMKAMLKYIDGKLDSHKEKLQEHDEDIQELKDKYADFKDVKKIVESDTETRKLIKKTAVGAIVTGIVGYILFQIGIVGG